MLDGPSIGDADTTVTGHQVYRIRYQVQRAILHEGDHAVLRWNATGTEWRVPIAQVEENVGDGYVGQRAPSP